MRTVKYSIEEEEVNTNGGGLMSAQLVIETKRFPPKINDPNLDDIEVELESTDCFKSNKCRRLKFANAAPEPEVEFHFPDDLHPEHEIDGKALEYDFDQDLYDWAVRVKQSISGRSISLPCFGPHVVGFIMSLAPTWIYDEFPYMYTNPNAVPPPQSPPFVNGTHQFPPLTCPDSALAYVASNLVTYEMRNAARNLWINAAWPVVVRGDGAFPNTTHVAMSNLRICFDRMQYYREPGLKAPPKERESEPMERFREMAVKHGNRNEENARAQSRGEVGARQNAVVVREYFRATLVEERARCCEDEDPVIFENERSIAQFKRAEERFLQEKPYPRGLPWLFDRHTKMKAGIVAVIMASAFSALAAAIVCIVAIVVIVVHGSSTPSNNSGTEVTIVSKFYHGIHLTGREWASWGATPVDPSL
ncbi:hypothetical protein M427DRAFT_49722 [Gonapodya prolifera JEL478]|uniref:Uncharacterized protein n=1 Tax=Gonapodya prolifera (strain JEL478) TaxID=1344416 RepID=A0A138ZXV5_GONPJ|nr:hypothetical protein M427DRAFT_49722 [Gonapodya prolifera JEL478]|eukprot:KXS09271.1 hypothetical protein M427DRAFT_49722 [Gonapodya prolifera JEL478]